MIDIDKYCTTFFYFSFHKCVFCWSFKVMLCLSMSCFIRVHSQLEHKQNYLIVWGEKSLPDMVNKRTQFIFPPLFIVSWHQIKEKRKSSNISNPVHWEVLGIPLMSRLVSYFVCGFSNRLCWLKLRTAVL